MNPFLLDILVIMLLVGALSLADSATTVLSGDLRWAKRLLITTLGTLILLIPLWLFVFSLSDPEKVFGYLSFVEILIGTFLWHAIWHFLENPFRIWLAWQKSAWEARQ